MRLKLPRSVVPAVVLLVVLLAAGACTGRSTSSSGPVGSSTTGGAQGRAGDPALGWGLEGLEGVDAFGSITDVDLLRESATRLGLSDEQVAAMSDGTVTFAEHEQLVRLALSCMEDRGLEVHEMGLKTTQRGVEEVAYAFSGDPAGFDNKETLTIARYCEQFHMVPATLIYEAEFGISLEEEQANINEAFIRFGECLRDAGITEIPDIDHYDPTMQDALLAYVDDPRHNCVLEVETP
jgi:hypothetical protein